jgi:predicted negative regulator of RcsB-dependent stress response
VIPIDAHHFRGVAGFEGCIFGDKEIEGRASHILNLRESALGAKKVKPVKKVQKKVLLPPETALERAKKWAEKNLITVISACAVALFAVLSVWGLNAYSHSKQALARSEYGVLASALPTEGRDTPADWEKIIPDLQKFIAAHKGTPPALNARIDLAKAFFETKRYDEAVKTGQEALALAPAGDGLRPLIIYQLGYAYESAGKLDEAVGQWSSLKQLGMSDLEREADWNLGRIAESKKDLTRAVEMYLLASKAPGDYPPASLLDQKIAGINVAGP